MPGRRAVLAGLAAAGLAPGGVSAKGSLGAFRRGDFDMVGVFDIDWLGEPRMLRMLDAMAASPGAFGAVRVFGVLNAGEREATFPVSSGSTWPAPEAAMDFSAALAALGAWSRVAWCLSCRWPSSPPRSPPRPLCHRWTGPAGRRWCAASSTPWWTASARPRSRAGGWRCGTSRTCRPSGLAISRATSACTAPLRRSVRDSGHAVRLGGPVIAWMPEEGPLLMRRFLEFLRDEPALQCDFLSYHRKGVWTEAEGAPRIARLVEAAEATAAMARALVPGRRLALVNDEADMKVGFDAPYAPRLDERFPSWLAASAIAHAALSLRHGQRFLAAADNANQHLVRAPFDGRRALFTRTDAGPADLLKLPVFGFYEMLRLLGDRGSRSKPGRSCTR